jgi:hypothetical protein
VRTVLGILLVCVPMFGSLEGSWLDSQGNRFQLTESGEVIRVSARGWSFETAAKHFTADLALSGVKSGNEFTAVQASTVGRWALKARVAPNGSLRATLEIPDEKPVNFILARETYSEQRLVPAAPKRMLVRLDRTSMPIGRWIPVSVGVAGADGSIVAPSEPVFIDLSAQGGQPIPPRVRVTPESPQAPAGVTMDSAEVTLKASSPGMTPVTVYAWGCVDTPVTAVRISTRRSDGVADGRDAVPLVAKFVDANGAPSHNQGRPKSLDWTVSGALRRPVANRQGVISDQAVGPEECVSLQEIISDRPGQAVVTARFANLREEVTLHFHAPLTAIAILWALFGGLLGGIASAVQNYKSAARWKARRWAMSLFTAEVGALTLFLGWHYGLLNAWPNAPSGAGFSFLVGMIGGWAGSRVLASFADSVLSGEKKRAVSAA